MFHFLEALALTADRVDLKDGALGDAELATTAIYADAQGPEQRQLVERMWR